MERNNVVVHQPQTTALAPAQSFDLSPRSFDEAMRMSEMLSDSTLVPKDFVGKPGNVFVAIQWGMELGLKPMQAMQNIAVINGRPSLWGDAVLALVLASPLCEYVEEWEERGIAHCKVKRRGKPEHIETFGDDDAKKAGLLNKQGPWSQYPKRMKKMRARAFALRDNFADVLKGIPIAEEAMDMGESKVPARNAPLRVASAAPADPSDELLAKARASAESGVEVYQSFWKGLSKESRFMLKNEHDRLKEHAITVDASKAEAPGQQAPEPVAPRLVEDCLNAAFEDSSIDDLDAAADMIRQVEGDDHQSVLTQQYRDLRAKLEAQQ